MLLRVRSQVFTCSGTRANSFTAQTAHLFFSLSSFPVGYNRRSLLAGALTGFHLFGYPRKFLNRANRALVNFALFIPVGYNRRLLLRVLSQVFTCSGTRANSITAQTAHLPFSLFFCFCRLLPTFAFGANSNVTKIA